MRNTKITSLATLLFFLGFVTGYLLATVIPKEASFIGAKLVVLVSIIGIAFFGKRIEIMLHSHTMEHWTTIASLGKWYFVITRYVLLRGTALFLLFVIPILLSMRISAIVILVSVCAYFFLAATLSYLGADEWKSCEHEVMVRSLKETGERLRVVQN